MKSGAFGISLHVNSVTEILFEAHSVQHHQLHCLAEHVRAHHQAAFGYCYRASVHYRIPHGCAVEICILRCEEYHAVECSSKHVAGSDHKRLFTGVDLLLVSGCGKEAVIVIVIGVVPLTFVRSYPLEHVTVLFCLKLLP